MRTHHPTDDEIGATFERVLHLVLNGDSGIRTETGFDMETEEALWAIIRVYPDVPEELVAAARAELAAQLDGTHARLRRERLARQFEEIKREMRQDR